MQQRPHGRPPRADTGRRQGWLGGGWLALCFSPFWSGTVLVGTQRGSHNKMSQRAIKARQCTQESWFQAHVNRMGERGGWVGRGWEGGAVARGRVPRGRRYHRLSWRFLPRSPPQPRSKAGTNNGTKKDMMMRGLLLLCVVARVTAVPITIPYFRQGYVDLGSAQSSSHHPAYPCTRP